MHAIRNRLALGAALAAVLALLGGAGAATAAAAGVAPTHRFAPRQLVVKFKGERHGRTVALPAGAGVLAAARALRAKPDVSYAQPNYAARASAIEPEPYDPNDPGLLEVAPGTTSTPGGWAQKEWDFLSSGGTATAKLPTSPGGIDVVGAWTNLIADGRAGAKGVVIAVLDSGVAYRDFGNQYLRSPDFAPEEFLPGEDFVDHDRLPLDENGHGTHVAGTIAEQTDNGVGLTGIAYGAKLIPIRVLNSSNVGYANRIAGGIRYAISHHAQIINMSFNFACGEKVPQVDEALREAYDRGIVTVASVGNLSPAASSSEICISEPATGPRVIGVGGATEGGCMGAYSLTGKGVDLVAPGGGQPVAGCPSVLSRPIYQVTLKAGTTNQFTVPSTYAGTSMAAAHVSGTAALVLASGVLSPALQGRARVLALTKRLATTARSLGYPRTAQGAGLIDAARATMP